jgi:hypothetical protein
MRHEAAFLQEHRLHLADRMERAALILNASAATMVMAWQVGANLLEGSETNLDYGFSLHHSGHPTLWGVRVAFMIMR